MLQCSCIVLLNGEFRLASFVTATNKRGVCTESDEERVFLVCVYIYKDKYLTWFASTLLLLFLFN